MRRAWNLHGAQVQVFDAGTDAMAHLYQLRDNLEEACADPTRTNAGEADCGLCEQCSFPSCLSVRFSLITGCLLAPTRTPYCGFSCLPPRLLLLLSSAGFLWCVSHVFGCVPPLVFALAVPPQPLSGPCVFLRVPACGPRLSRDPALAYRAFFGGAFSGVVSLFVY